MGEDHGQNTTGDSEYRAGNLEQKGADVRRSFYGIWNMPICNVSTGLVTSNDLRFFWDRHLPPLASF